MAQNRSSAPLLWLAELVRGGVMASPSLGITDKCGPFATLPQSGHLHLLSTRACGWSRAADAMAHVRCERMGAVNPVGQGFCADDETNVRTATALDEEHLSSGAQEKSVAFAHSRQPMAADNFCASSSPCDCPWFALSPARLHRHHGLDAICDVVAGANQGHVLTWYVGVPDPDSRDATWHSPLILPTGPQRLVSHLEKFP